VRWADRHIQGGLGIVLDDVPAAIYAAVALLVLLAIVGAFRVRS
jgi:phosphatidylglycerophosphatase A